MKKIVLLILLSIPGIIWAETKKPTLNQSDSKPKPIKYNAFGCTINNDQYMAGGNHIAFRKSGFALCWRVGIKNLMEPSKMEDASIDELRINNRLTGNVMTNYSYSIMPGYGFAIFKKVPLVLAAGVVRQKQYLEYLPLNTTNEYTWTINPEQVKFYFNASAQLFVPISNRIILNVGYDLLPAGIFCGITIGSATNFIDIDEW